MKTLTLLIAALLTATISIAQPNTFPANGSVGIGTANPDSSAILEIKSTHSGLLIPRMSMAQRDSIALPAVGLLVFQTDSVPGFYYFNGTIWTAVKSEGANASLSNLQPTTINVSLLPSVDNSISLGNSSKKWSSLYTSQIHIDGEVFITNGAVEDSANTFIGATQNIANTGGQNVFVGHQAGRANTSGSDNTFVGKSAGTANTVGSGNSFFGMNAGLSNTSGNENTLIGYGAGEASTIGSSNTLVGYKSGIKNTTGSSNAFFGVLTGNQNTTESQNVHCGGRAGISATAANNTFVGYSSGSDITTGESNTFIGALADASAGTVSNSIAIGFNCKIDQSNAIRLGNSNVAKIGIGKNPDASNILDFEVTTAKLTTGGVWTNASDRKLKNNFEKLDAQDILHRVNQLQIQRWHYIADPEGISHIGPVAQDFHKLFNVGDDTTISSIDPSGVALLAIQALTQMDKERDAAIAKQQQQIDELKMMAAGLQQALSQCCLTYENEKQPAGAEERKGYLEQNVPNPVTDNTSIKCHLPADVNSGMLIISSVDGRELKSFMLNHAGRNEITLNGSTLPAGEYIYSLIIDGEKVDSKRMVLIEK